MESRHHLPIETALYTRTIVNTPSRIKADLRRARETLKKVALFPICQQAAVTLEVIRVRDEARRREILNNPGRSPCDPPAADPTDFNTFEHFETMKRAVSDPTTLILVEEANRFQMNSLETMRSIFDEGALGLVLIGMPDIKSGSLGSLILLKYLLRP